MILLSVEISWQVPPWAFILIIGVTGVTVSGLGLLRVSSGGRVMVRARPTWASVVKTSSRTVGWTGGMWRSPAPAVMWRSSLVVIPGVPMVRLVGVPRVPVVSLVVFVILVTVAIPPVHPALLTLSLVPPVSPRVRPGVLPHRFPLPVLLHHLLLPLHHLPPISVGLVALVDVETELFPESLGEILPWLLLVSGQRRGWGSFVAARGPAWRPRVGGGVWTWIGSVTAAVPAPR